MGCCKDCESVEGMAERNVKLDFFSQDQEYPELIGENFKITGWNFINQSGSINTEKRRVQISKTGETYLISVYLDQMPFDELECTVQFDPKTGKIRTRVFVTTEWKRFDLYMFVKPVKPAEWFRIAPTIYRVRSYAGIVDLIESYGATNSAIGARLRQDAKHTIFPALVAINSNMEYTLIHANNVMIPDWKNDSVWK